MDRLQQVVECLLHDDDFNTVDAILDVIPIKDNRFTDLVELIELCDKHSSFLMSLAWFKKRLVDKIYEQRGPEGKSLINRVMKIKEIK